MVSMKQIKAIGGSRKVWNSGWPNRKAHVRASINRGIEKRFRKTQAAAVEEGLDDEFEEMLISYEPIDYEEEDYYEDQYHDCDCSECMGQGLEEDLAAEEAIKLLLLAEEEAFTLLCQIFAQVAKVA